MFIKRHNTRKNPKNDDFYANFPKKMGEKREFRVKIGSEIFSTGYHMKDNFMRNRFQPSNLIFQAFKPKFYSKTQRKKCPKKVWGEIPPHAENLKNRKNKCPQRAAGSCVTWRNCQKVSRIFLWFLMNFQKWPFFKKNFGGKWMLRPPLSYDFQITPHFSCGPTQGTHIPNFIKIVSAKKKLRDFLI